MFSLDPELWAVFSTSTSAYAFVALLGALWGSFGNVCIYRWPPSDEFPHGRSVVAPGSHCFECGADVRWYDNVPLLSYLWLRGACRDCKASFSPRYLLVEGAAAMLFVAAYHYVVAIAFISSSPWEQLLRFAILACFLWVLLIITFIDLDHQLILDKLTYPAIPIFYGLGLLLPAASVGTGLVGIAAGYVVVRIISDGFWLLAGREGMGYGDGKLLAIIGALYGWKAVIVSLFLGAFVGTIVSISMLALTRGRSTEADSEGERLGRVAVPFGPFLATAAVVYVFIEDDLEIYLAPLW
ncbi:MAG: prepilin peptidase [Myxococcales bacterium]|nr:prepilin peptidase [Myxococcales bacterium]